MLEQTFAVRFYETDALAHVSNTVLAGWFEAAREPIFRIFTPSLDLQNWPLILARYNIDFHQQIFYGQEVLVKTGISRIGNSSFEVYQQVWQGERMCASGTTTMVHFDYAAQRSAKITPTIKTELEALFTDIPASTT